MALLVAPPKIQQRSKASKRPPSPVQSQTSPVASQPPNPENDQGNSKRRLRYEIFRTFQAQWNTYYHMTSPIGKMRWLFVTLILCTILGILLFHPPCYRHRTRALPLCRISHEMGLIPQLPQGSKKSKKHSEGLPPQERTRLLLGFMTSGNDEQEKQRRQSIRTALLSYARGDGDNEGKDHGNYGQVCCLADYLASPEEYRYCQVVYTFLQGGNPDGAHLDFNSTYRSLLSFDQTSFFAEQRKQQRQEKSASKDDNGLVNSHEPDVTFLNIQDVNNVRKVFAWYDYTTKLRMERGRKFDYVAFTDTDHTIDVPTFLDNKIFQMRSTTPMTYGGKHVETKSCVAGQDRTRGHVCTELCSDLTIDGFMTNMVVLSHDVVSYAISHNNLIQLNGAFPQDCPEIAVANLLRYNTLSTTHLEGIITS